MGLVCYWRADDDSGGQAAVRSPWRGCNQAIRVVVTSRYVRCSIRPPAHHDASVREAVLAGHATRHDTTMIIEDQSAVIAFLASIGDPPVERIDTHTAVVFLGSRALKLKRAVKYDYLDLSTADRRKTMCEEEVRLNRRTAPDIYVGVRAVTRQSDGALALDGSGTPVDWVVEMRRFDQEALCDRLATSGRLDLGLMPRLGGAVARFHAGAVVRGIMAAPRACTGWSMATLPDLPSTALPSVRSILQPALA